MKNSRKFAVLVCSFALLLSGGGVGTASEQLVPQSYQGPTPPPIDTRLGNDSGHRLLRGTGPVGGTARTTQGLYPEGTPIRGYFTVMSVPDGWNTEDFLISSGWIEIANKRAEGLFVLEPDQSTRQWGSVAAESAYITAALRSWKRRFYSTHGVNYIAGYGSGGTALQSYVANNPLYVISAAFIDTSDLGNLAAIGAQEFNSRRGSPPLASTRVSRPCLTAKYPFRCGSSTRTRKRGRSHCLLEACQRRGAAAELDPTGRSIARGRIRDACPRPIASPWPRWPCSKGRSHTTTSVHDASPSSSRSTPVTTTPRSSATCWARGLTTSRDSASRSRT